MTALVVGAGAVGLTLGARLSAAGERVCFVTRRSEQAQEIARRGVRVLDPASGRVVLARADAVAGIEAAGGAAGPVWVCVRSPHSEEVADRLSLVSPGAVPVCVQNDLDNEAVFAARFPRVLGAVYRQTCTRTGDAEVSALGAGRMVLGAHPRGAGAEVEALAARLRAAGYDAGVSPRIDEDKWLKLCVNLMSAPNALAVRDDHESAAFVEVKARCLEEARDALAAAGVRARSCDGRDRSLEEEIAFQRAALSRGQSARRLPLYNQVWQALRRGLPLEADRYHGRILALAAQHALAAPVNSRVLEVLLQVQAAGKGPESVRAADLLPG